MTTKPFKSNAVENSQGADLQAANSRWRGWVVQIPVTGFGALMQFRLSERLEACEAEGVTWVRFRGAENDETAHFGEEVRVALAAKLFHWSPMDEAVPWGCRVPVGRLPEGPWVALRSLMKPEVPATGFAARGVERCDLRLVRSDELQEVSVLRTTLTAWEAYARRTSAMRLRRLSFVANQQGEVLVFGKPLPQIEGAMYWEREGLIVPAGWRWSPWIDAGLVREVLGLEEEECAFWRDGEGGWERLKRNDFVAAQRRNVRETLQPMTTWREWENR